jgi:protein TonB
MKRFKFAVAVVAVVLGLSASRLCAEEEFVKFDKPPAPQKTPPPKYPAGMTGVDGIVMVLVVIDEEGSVTSATVSKSSSPEFDAPSVEAIKRWKFKPAEKAGAPVKARVTIPLHFKPDN